MGKNFGDKLKCIRLERKLSQEDLATILNTSKQVISRYETNQRTPKITIAKEYADKLNVPLNYLIDDSVSDIKDTESMESAPNKNIPKDLKKILEEKTLMFDGEVMNEEDKQLIERMLTNMYYKSKEQNKRK